MEKKKQFNLEMKHEDRSGYVAYVGKKIEICFEPCLNGCDVAVYDKKLDLLEPKFCTNLKNFDLFDKPKVIDQLQLRVTAFSKAQEYYEKYELKNSKKKDG